MSTAVLPPVEPTSLPRVLPAAPDVAPIVDLPRRAFVAQVMGLPMSLHVRGPLARDGRVAAAVEAAFTALRADEAMFSPWRATSSVSRIRSGALRLEDAPTRVQEVAALCVEAADRTGGAFSAWRPGPDGVPAFDPTGLVKGWAVEQAFTGLRRRLARLDVAHDVMLCAGGDIAVACARTDTPDWRVGVEDPRDRSRLLLAVPLRTGAVATSGTAARGEHIVDPGTGRPVAQVLSATVVGPSLTWADVNATAAFVKGTEAAAWIGGLAGHTGVVVHLDGRVETAHR